MTINSFLWDGQNGLSPTQDSSVSRAIDYRFRGLGSILVRSYIISPMQLHFCQGRKVIINMNNNYKQKIPVVFLAPDFHGSGVITFPSFFWPTNTSDYVNWWIFKQIFYYNNHCINQTYQELLIVFVSYK